jgi:sugar lactone lactonase YvrE
MKTKDSIIYVICIFFISIFAFAEKTSYEIYLDYYNQANKAIENKDYLKAIEFFRKELEISPYRPNTYFNISLMYINLADKDKAIDNLRKALILGLEPDKKYDRKIQSLSESPNYYKISTLLNQINKPINNSQVAFELPIKDLIPEGIAYDPGEDCFYLSSIYKRKILKIKRDGTASDFTTEKQDGLQAVLGLKVDPKRNILWAVTETGERTRPDTDQKMIGWTALVKYDLKTGKLIKKYEILEPGTLHQFNDIAITSRGDVYVSDSLYNAIYLVKNETDKLELFIKGSEFIYPNGITIGKDDNTLYLASSGDGVYKINISTKKYKRIEQPDDITLCGLDGMYFYKNSLVAIQNDLNRISRFYLTKDGSSVKRVEIIEKGNQYFVIPTTGVIIADTLYYIANSQMDALDSNGEIAPEAKLKNTIILKTKLY